MPIKSFFIVGKSIEKVAHAKQEFIRAGLTYNPDNPDIIVCQGGDGTFLFAERNYPSTPKLLIRDSLICQKCNNDSQEHIFKHIKLDELIQEKIIKLAINFKNQQKLAVNDFIFRNAELSQAIRFTIKIDNQPLQAKEIIADGLVVATSFGSSGYFNSITNTSFHHGLGLAINNPTNKMQPILLNESSEIKIVLIRGNAHFTVDNDPPTLSATKDAPIIVRKANLKATLLKPPLE